MASLLRHIVAGPRAKHAETGLDLCYVTSNIIATSGPSQTYPQKAYRNPLDRLVAFLDAKHGVNWAIWEFRAEGTGYPDEAVYGRIRHYPWPDHHPPPFHLVPLIVASMKQWLQDAKEGPERVVVVHCKAGKGRSGTMACSYLIAECGWTPEKALARFTERRMRPRFGAGVTIPSQLRWIGYVDRWARHGKKYVDRAVEIVEVHVWGLRHGVKVAVEGFVDEGKRIQAFHTFDSDERIVVEGDAPGGGGFVDLVSDMASPLHKEKESEKEKEKAKGKGSEGSSKESVVHATANEASKASIQRQKTDLIVSPTETATSASTTASTTASSSTTAVNKTNIEAKKNESTASLPSVSSATSSINKSQTFSYAAQDEPGGQAVIFKPKTPIRVPNSDVNIALERRNKASMGLTMVTSVAHVWFNVFFEGHGPEQDGRADDNGVFTIDWDKMDGIKGSSQRGTMAAERIAVVWRMAEKGGEEGGETKIATAKVPTTDNGQVAQMRPANWQGGNNEDPDARQHLGLHRDDDNNDNEGSAKASSSLQGGQREEEEEEEENPLEQVKSSGPKGEELDMDIDTPKDAK